MDNLQEFIKLARAFFYLARSKHRAWTRIIDRDKGHGMWRRIGAGHYGEAWAHTMYPDLVLKISGRAQWGNDVFYFEEDYLYNMKVRLDAWPVFARHCRDNPHPKLPKIMHFEQPSEGMAWAVLPRYRSMDEYSPGVYDRLDHERIKLREMLQGLETAPDWMWPLRQMAGSLYFRVDLHSGNVMVDPKTGELIITDPFSATGPSTAASCSY